ncbi:MAG: SIMPL domain-containing protein [Bdellovibrio sp.]
MKKAAAFVLTGTLMLSGLALADSRLVVVSGDCLRNLTPDRAAITLTSEALEKNPGAAMEKATDQYNRVRERIKKLNLKNMELETSEFGVQEDIDWSNNKKTSRGFRARLGLRITTSETAKLGELAMLASELKVQDVSGLQHFVSRETLQKERQACLEDAFQNARAKAEKLAKVSGQKLGSAAYIQEDSASAPSPRPKLMAQMESRLEAASSVPIFEAGTNKMMVNVQVGFDLK